MSAQNRIEKLALNNQIVLMRKDVKRARVWLVNNFNHKIKKLRSLKNAEETILAKNCQRIDKLRKEIQTLKKIHVDEVSKFALCYKPELLSKSSNQGETEITHSVMLKIANHKLVQSQIQKFRQTYSIPGDRLVLLVRSLGLQYQKKKKALQKAHNENNEKCDSETDSIHPSLDSCPSLESKEDNPNNECPRTIQLNIEEEIQGKPNEKSSVIPNPNNCNLSSKDFSISSVKKKKRKLQSESINSNHVITKEPSETTITPSNVKVSINTDESSHGSVLNSTSAKKNSKQNKIKESTISPDKSTLPSLPDQQIDKRYGSVEIKQLRLDECDSETIVIHTPEVVKQEKASRELPRDSFFLGGIDVSSDEDEEKNDKNKSSVSKMGFRFQNHLGRTTENQRQPKRMLPPSVNRKFEPKEPAKTHSEPEILHPSWQAKRKEKQLIISPGSFQGKKIVFDND